MLDDWLVTTLRQVKSKAAVQAALPVLHSHNHHLQLLNLLKDSKLQAKAAWLLQHAVENRPEAFQVHVDYFLEQLEYTTHPAVARSLLRSLLLLDLTPKQCHWALNLALAYLEDTEQTVAVKVFSLKLLQKHHEKLGTQIDLVLSLIAEQWPTASAGFKSAARHFLKIADTKYTDKRLDR